jgi:hypothetical protein
MPRQRPAIRGHASECLCLGARSIHLPTFGHPSQLKVIGVRLPAGERTTPRNSSCLAHRGRCRLSACFSTRDPFSFRGGPSMLRRITNSMFEAPSRRRLDRLCTVAAVESLEDRSLLSASCVTSCAASCAPSACRPSGCAPIVCNTGAACLSFAKLLCAIEKFEQTLCQTSTCGQCGQSCGGECQKSCHPCGTSCSEKCAPSTTCDAGNGECAPHPTCGNSAR